MVFTWPLTDMVAPVAIFAYSRPVHLQQVLDALRADSLAPQTPLFIFCDAPANIEVKYNSDQVKKIAYSASGFASINIIERSQNFGLAKSIIQGVTYILTQYERVIVLEDDLIVSPFFLKYMNEALELYRQEPLVAAIHGYLLPLKASLPETFFLKGADCWGWGTWRRAWGLFNPDGAELLRELKLRSLTNEFDLNGAYPYTKMLADQVNGFNQSWAIRWQASVFLNDMVTLYPGRSLVRNIGHDNSGVHCNKTNQFDVCLSESEIKVERMPIQESLFCLNAVRDYHVKNRWLPRRLFRYLAVKCSDYLKIDVGWT